MGDHVRRELLRLQGNRDTALAAADQLWNTLCTEGSCLASAGAPASPFLLEMLDEAPPELQIELLDIVLRFTELTHPTIGGRPGWATEVRRQMAAARIKFEVLAGHPDEEVSGFAQTIVELLDGEDPPGCESILTHPSGEPRTDRSHPLRALRSILDRMRGKRR